MCFSLQLRFVDHVNASLETPISWSDPEKLPLVQNTASENRDSSNQSPSSNSITRIDPAAKVFECKICDVACVSEAMLQQHLAGKKHNKQMFAYK